MAFKVVTCGKPDIYYRGSRWRSPGAARVSAIRRWHHYELLFAAGVENCTLWLCFRGDKSTCHFFTSRTLKAAECGHFPPAPRPPLRLHALCPFPALPLSSSLSAPLFSRSRSPVVPLWQKVAAGYVPRLPLSFHLSARGGGGAAHAASPWRPSCRQMKTIVPN